MTTLNIPTDFLEINCNLTQTLQLIQANPHLPACLQINAEEDPLEFENYSHVLEHMLDHYGRESRFFVGIRANSGRNSYIILSPAPPLQTNQ